jgi:hypothetical protein
LVGKIDSLEKQVRAAVDGGAESFKEKVEQVAQSVKQTLDLRHQIEQHPWAALGGSLVVGYLVGSLVSRERAISAATGREATTDGDIGSNLERPPAAMGLSATERSPSATRSYGRESENDVPTFVEELIQQLAPELRELKVLAIRVAAELLKEVIEQALESVRSSRVPRTTDSTPPHADSAPTLGSPSQDCV